MDEYAIAPKLALLATVFSGLFEACILLLNVFFFTTRKFFFNFWIYPKTFSTNPLHSCSLDTHRKHHGRPYRL